MKVNRVTRRKRISLRNSYFSFSRDLTRASWEMGLNGGLMHKSMSLWHDKCTIKTRRRWRFALDRPRRKFTDQTQGRIKCACRSMDLMLIAMADIIASHGVLHMFPTMCHYLYCYTVFDHARRSIQR